MKTHCEALKVRVAALERGEGDGAGDVASGDASVAVASVGHASVAVAGAVVQSPVLVTTGVNVSEPSSLANSSLASGRGTSTDSLSSEKSERVLALEDLVEKQKAMLENHGLSLDES